MFLRLILAPPTKENYISFVVFFSENADPIMPLVGYYKPQQIELFLKMIKQGDYQVFTKPEDFENYQKNFRPRFRG